MDNFNSVIDDWADLPLPRYIKRDIKVSSDLMDEFIISITGPRRAGKTYVLFQMMDDLLRNQGIARENIFYVDLEDDRLFPFQTTELDTLVARFQEISKIDHDQPIFLFLDEIQNIERWSAWVRRIHDLRKDVRIVISGSSSKLLHTEIATNLRGRTFNYTIFPVSFREFLRFRGESEIQSFPSQQRKVKLKNLFNQYMAAGGFPQIAFNERSPEERKQILQGYFEVMLLRDVIERHNVRNTYLLRMLAKMLVNSISREFSYSKTHRALKSMGHDVAKHTIIEYVQYLEDSYVFFQNGEYSSSLRQQMASIKKVYCIDVGLVDALSFRSSEDRGWHLENLVYVELLRRKKEIFYHRNTSECDFVIQEGISIVELIQVCADMSDPPTREREIKGLQKAMDRFELSSGTILTEDEFEDIEAGGKTIHIRPVWYWLQDVPTD